MSRYIIKRLCLVFFVGFIISVIMFSLYQVIPGGEEKQLEALVDSSLRTKDPEAYREQYEAAQQKIGIGQSTPVKYVKWLRNLVTGDWGRTIQSQQPILQAIKAPMKNTIRMNILNLIFVFLITFPLGIYTAVKKYSKFDNAVQVFTSVGMSLPSFFIALISILIFASFLGWLPTTGAGSPDHIRDEMSGFARMLDTTKYLVLPVLVLTVSSLAGITRYVRGAMIDVLSQDFIRTARSKGVKEKVVIYSHAFRNAMIPVVTILVGWFLGIFGGSTITETIFAYPGMGRTLFAALNAADYNFVMVLNVFYTIIGLLGNLLVDILYTVVDPRVRLG